MKLSRYILRSLSYYRRTNLAVVAGVATAVAVLSGALLVGESVRHSLRTLLYQRIGATEYLVTADHFFREDLGAELELPPAPDRIGRISPLIILQGITVHEATGRRALNVNVYGIDERFWKLHGIGGVEASQGRAVLVGASLAEKLAARPGDSILLRIETQHDIPRESLYGRREMVGRTIRLSCGDILPAEALGEFALQTGQGAVYSMFVPLQRLQRDLAKPSAVNAILLSAGGRDSSLEKIRNQLKEKLVLRDLGIRLRALPLQRGFSVESTRIILDDVTARAALGAAAEAGMEASGVYSYMANSIRAGGREIPYSVITAVDLGRGAMNSVRSVRGFPPLTAAPGANDSIWLNEWAWRDLGAARGDRIEVDYYLWQEEGRLTTRTARFRFEGVVAIGGDIDAALAPAHPGITEAKSITAWDPPFPLDLRRIRPADEEYWDRHRATPKAFVTLAGGQELWQNRYGKHSAVRVALPPGTNLQAAQKSFMERLRSRLDPGAAGFSVSDVRARGLAASRGSTDFGEYFVYFSFFLILAALMLAALFFRLGIEQRAREIGMLRAAGIPASALGRIFLGEGAVLSFAGSMLGLLGAIAYGRMLVLALSTWWVDAVGTSRLYLHLSWTYLGIGAVSGMAASLLANAWTLRSLERNSPRALLAGDFEPPPARRRRAIRLGILSAAAFAMALLLIVASALGQITDVAGFFGAGSLLLVSILSLTGFWLRRKDPRPIVGRGWPALFRLGARNAGHRPGRSLLCMALIASAAFIIISAAAFRRDERSVSLEPSSGTGGYPLLAQSSLPILYDPDSEAGREALGIPTSEAPELEHVRFTPFRVRPGDDVSCLNLYAPQEPRVLGVSHSFASGARFSFQDSLASSPEERRNPWLLLESALPDGAVPAIADANTIQYILHLAVGRDLMVRGTGGTPVRLRLVAALRDSIFQRELLISEGNFLRIFPDQEGFRFFLLDAPPAQTEPLIQSLEERLAEWGVQVDSTRRRLAAFHQVENAYISSFQSLGGLGLVLGTVGLATVLLRNVLERRKELALLRAAGYRRGVISGIIVAENLVLLVWGLACGAVSALTAVLPALHSRGMPIPLSMVSLLLGAVLAVGLASSLVAVIATHRSPLLEALRSE